MSKARRRESRHHPHEWECVQASREAIHAVVSALALTVDLASVFQGVSKGAIYSLRTIVCYFGHHYQVCCRLMAQWRSSTA